MLLSTPDICGLWIKTLIAEIRDRLLIQSQSKLGPTFCDFRVLGGQTPPNVRLCTVHRGRLFCELRVASR
jgi:hypothetical protein